jgi:sugar lactone lactonase YvrE/ribosomal protein S11
MKNLILLITWLGVLNLVSAQVGIGQWETFLTYGNGTSVAINGTQVFCGTQEGLYSYNYSSNEFAEFTKPSGYVGLGVTAVGYSPKSNTTIVAYDDANLDLLKNGEIVNLPQIKNYSLTGDKKIYNITIAGDSAILSCGFGVVVVDIKQEIIKTDVKFSDDLAFAGEVCYDAAIMGGYYYFATSQGVYKVLYTSNIKDLSNWNLVSGLPAGSYNTLATHNGTLYLNYSNYLTNSLDNSDTLYTYNGVSAAVYQPGWLVRINDIVSNNGYLGLLAPEEARIMDGNGVLQTSIPTGCFTRSQKIEIDPTGKAWIALIGSGMVSHDGSSCDIHYLDGPFSKNVWDMQIVNGDIWVATGGVNINWGNVYIADKMYYRRNGDWKWYNIPDMGYYLNHTDIHTLAVDPSNAGHVYAGAWGTGLYEGQNYGQNSFQYLYPEVDSAASIPQLNYKVGGMAFDEDMNLWFSNSNTDQQLKVKRSNGTWGSISLTQTSSSNTVGKVAVDQRGQVWVAVHGKGIVVYDIETGQQRLLSSTYNNGDLPQLTVRALECDLDGQMWVGTHDGIRVFSPSQVFGSVNINGQKIVIKDENGINELLLKETIINDIETDGANRKWIATMGTGVRLVSSDGREIIHSFTAENSPLLSNNVNCVAIDDQSGEVCFGTDKGIVCFRSDATAASDNFGNVYAYPNPVKPEYNGPIAITGMANNSAVKITDIAGNLVFETTSEGGQAIWNGLTYEGKRPSTGVYLVFCANEDASQTVVTKILFIH